jgi:hypothetical protein
MPNPPAITAAPSIQFLMVLITSPFSPQFLCQTGYVFEGACFAPSNVPVMY